MNKKFLGVRVSTIIAAVVCVALSFLIWTYVRYEKIATDTSAAAFLFTDEI